MRITMVFPVMLAIALLSGSALLAQEGKKGDGSPGEKSPDEVTTGELRIKMSSDYAKLRIDGDEWEEHEFIDKGFTLVVHGLNRTVDHKVTLTPVTPDLAPAEMVIKPDEWKLAPMAKNTKIWRVERKVDFQKSGAKPPPVPKAEPKPEPEPKPKPEPKGDRK